MENLTRNENNSLIHPYNRAVCCISPEIICIWFISMCYRLCFSSSSSLPQQLLSVKACLYH